MAFKMTLSNDGSGQSISVPITDAQMASLFVAPAPPPVVTPPATNPSGIAMPVGDLPSWRQILAEDFTRDCPIGGFLGAYPGWWSYANGIPDTSKHGVRTMDIVSVSNGCLDMYLHAKNGVPQGACPCPPGPAGKGQLYGRYSACFRVVGNLPGYKTAWLLWPVSEAWPRDSEVDFPESETDLTGQMSAFMHWQRGTSGSSFTAYRNVGAYGQGWHVVTISWTPKAISFELDGKVVGTFTDTAKIPNTPMRMVYQTETSTSGPAPAASVAGHVQCDWLVAYSWQG
jgi:hypothetical protein